MELSAPLRVMVPAEAVNVLEFAQLPETLKLELVVVIPEILTLTNAKVPELLIDPPDLVIVPPDGEKFPVASTESMLATVKFELVVVVPLMVSPPKVRILEFVIEPPAIVIVTPLPVRVVPDSTVKSWSMAVAYETVVVPVPEVDRL